MRVVVWANLDNGQKYPLKTNKKGEYFSLGLTPGKYLVTLYKTADDMKADKELDHVKGFRSSSTRTLCDFDVKKDMEDAAKGKGLSPEQLKQMQEAQAKQAKETNTVKSLNEKLNAAKTAADAGDYDTAIAALTEATQMDATRDLIWFKLGDYYRCRRPSRPIRRKSRSAWIRRSSLIRRRWISRRPPLNDKDPNARQEPGRLLQQPGGRLLQG